MIIFNEKKRELEEETNGGDVGRGCIKQKKSGYLLFRQKVEVSGSGLDTFGSAMYLPTIQPLHPLPLFSRL